MKVKQVRCVQTGEVYPSINSAAKSLSLDVSNLMKHLQGRGKSIKGYKFEYLEEAESIVSPSKNIKLSKPQDSKGLTPKKVLPVIQLDKAPWEA